MATDNAARIWAVMGQSGTGKGLWVKKKLKELKPNRILILDPQDEYGDFAAPFSSARDLATMITKAGDSGPFRVRYVFPKSADAAHFASVFNLACKLAYLARNCVFLPEELSNFTTPTVAPPLWKRMCNSGRHEGVHVIGVSQYPAQIDKAFLSNATLIHVGFLGEESHRKAVASRMDIPQEAIRDLPDLAYLEWERATRTVSRGKIAISGRYTQAPLTPTGEIATVSGRARAKK
jgi:DNA helicase HerA-like ATPase